MKTLRNIINENVVNESKVSISCLENPNDVKYDITPGWYEGGFPGILIGKPFKYGDSKGDDVALKLVKKFGLDLGNDYDDIIDDIEYDYEDEAKDLWFAYFLNIENYKVDCYIFGDGGVYALK